ncbi:MAG: hypothetical protein ACXVZL_02765 [Gaiellaceae bacterium]
MKVVEYETRVRTAGRRAVLDLTDEVEAAVRESGIEQGVACLYSPHTTCRLRVAAGPAGLGDRLAPAGGLLPVRDGELVDGARRILLVELDRDRERTWLLQVVGD